MVLSAVCLDSVSRFSLANWENLSLVCYFSGLIMYIYENMAWQTVLSCSPCGSMAHFSARGSNTNPNPLIAKSVIKTGIAGQE